MAVDPAWYAGREQAFVKHSFLDRYLGRLFNKVASSRPALAYVDGFAGPWKSASEEFEDTSFGIALNQLRGAKKQARHPVRAIAHLIEQDAGAFSELQTVRGRFPDIEVILHNSDFHEALPTILSAIPVDAFSFFLLDPKGWRDVDLQRLAPMLKQQNSEVVINLMYDFINRFIEHPNERISDRLDSLLPGPAWREAIRNAPTDVAAAREAIITETYSNALKQAGAFRYAPTLRVRRPGRDRTLYHLVYATRSPIGLSVFRDCQVKALQAEAEVQSGLKRKSREEKTGMATLFTNDMETSFDQAAQFLQMELKNAVAAAVDLLRARANGIRWGQLWPEILDKFAVTQSGLGREMNRLRKAGRVRIDAWPSGRKLIPEDDYEIWLA